MSPRPNEPQLPVIDPSIIQVLSLLNTSAAGKKQAGNIGSMIDFLADPWLGVLTGGYDPLAGVQQNVPSRYRMDQIANDPEAPDALKSVASSIAQGVPIYQVLREIDAVGDTGGFTRDELKSFARELDSEQQQFMKASSQGGSDMFSKAGLPSITERYSDRPELAPLSADTQLEMRRLLSQAGEAERRAELGRQAAGRAPKPKKGLSYEQAKKEMESAGAAYKLATEKVPTKDRPAANITENPFGVTYGDDGVSMTPNTPENMSRLAEEARVRYEKAKKVLAATPKNPKKAAISKTWGDLNDPENLKRYFASTGAQQKANYLRSQAQDLQSQAIAGAEAQGRTPLMDMLANRILASRLMGA